MAKTNRRVLIAWSLAARPFSTSDILRIEFRPVFRWQGYAPNVLWFRQRDPAVQGPLRMDVDNLGKRTFVRQDDADLDPHADAQRNEGGDQCSVKIDHGSIAFTNQGSLVP